MSVQLSSLPPEYMPFSDQGEGLPPTRSSSNDIPIKPTTPPSKPKTPPRPISSASSASSISSASSASSASAASRTSKAAQRNLGPERAVMDNKSNGTPQSDRRVEDDCCRCCEIAAGVQELNRGIQSNDPARIIIGAGAIQGNQGMVLVSAVDNLQHLGK